MSPEEIQAMAKGLAEGQAVWYVLSAIIGGLITGAGAYLAEKGKNRATKEDIGQITQAVEAVKSEFSEKLEDLKAHHQLRMVAAERRLQAHQEAYTHWQGLYDAALSLGPDIDGPAKLKNEIGLSRNWYLKNCIFLGPRSRTAFSSASGAAVIHLVRVNDDTFSGNDYLRNWQVLEDASKIILEEVELPVISIPVRNEAQTTP